MILSFPLKLSAAQQRVYKVSEQHCRLRNTASLVASIFPFAFLFNPKSETNFFGEPTARSFFFGVAIAGIILGNFVQYCRDKEVSVFADVFVVLCSTICNFVSLYIYIVRLEDVKDSLMAFGVTVSVWVIVPGSDMASRWIDLCRWSYSLWRNRVDKTSILPLSSLQQDIELQDCSTSSPNNIQEPEGPAATQSESTGTGAADDSNEQEARRRLRSNLSSLMILHVAKTSARRIIRIGVRARHRRLRRRM